MVDDTFQPLATIDFHTHFPLSPVTSFTPDMKKIPSFEDFMKALDVAHVTEAVLLCGPKKGPMREENEKLTTRIEPFKRRFLPIAWLNPRYDTAADLQDLVNDSSFNGLKLHPVFDGYKLTQKEVKPLIEKAIELDKLIMIHSGWGPEGSVQEIGKLAEEHPEGKFVCCHMKEEFGLNKRFSHIEMAVRNQNIWLECSYIPHPRRLTEAVDILGADRILFGSDYPWGAQNISWEKTKVISAQITSSEKKQILAENAKKLLKM